MISTNGKLIQSYQYEEIVKESVAMEEEEEFWAEHALTDWGDQNYKSSDVHHRKS